MKRFVGALAAIILIVIAIFDVGKEGREVLGLGPVVILLVFGAIMWLLFARLNSQKSESESALPINLAIWCHSLFEGALAAISFEFGWRQGLVVCTALLLHLLPECLAIIAILRQRGFSYTYGLKIYAVTILILLSSFVVFNLLSIEHEAILSSLACLVAGGFIYLGVSTFSIAAKQH